MLEQYENLIKLRSQVVEDDLKTFKLCGREKCKELIQKANDFERQIGYPLSEGQEDYFGNKHGFVNIVNINMLISYSREVVNY